MSVRKKLCRVEDVPEGGATAVEADQAGMAVPLILLRRRGDLLAYENQCPHTGRRLDWAPGRFLVEDDQLICAAHGACFAIATGNCTGGPARGAALASVAIAIVDGEVWLA